MDKINFQEWSLHMPWGEMAVASWGHPTDIPVLLIHGYMDSLSTYNSLLKLLPEGYYYVSFDWPGHGKSDKYPVGLLPSQNEIIYVIRRVIQDLGWDRFFAIGHSVGYVFGVFYNSVYPGEIQKLVAIDGVPPIAQYHTTNTAPKVYYNLMYDSYYRMKEFKRNNYDEPKNMTKDQAIGSIARNRKVSKDQAEVLLSRALIPVGDGKYKFSWDPKMKRFNNIGLSTDLLVQMLKNCPPTLVLISSITIADKIAKPWAEAILKEVSESRPHFFMKDVEGGHDVHITNPERIIDDIKKFFSEEFVTLSKL